MVFYHKIILIVIYFIFYAKIFEKSLYTIIYIKIKMRIKIKSILRIYQ
jgi:hypothetical protein